MQFTEIKELNHFVTMTQKRANDNSFNNKNILSVQLDNLNTC